MARPVLPDGEARLPAPGQAHGGRGAAPARLAQGNGTSVSDAVRGMLAEYRVASLAEACESAGRGTAA